MPSPVFLSRLRGLHLPRRVGGEVALRHPVALGFGLLGLLVIGLFLAQGALGRQPFGDAGRPGDLLVALLHCVILAYVIGAYFAVVQRGTRSLGALRSQTASSGVAGHVLKLPPLAAPTAGWGVAAVLGAAFAFFGPYLTEPYISGPVGSWDVQTWQPEVYWHRLLGLGIGVWFGWFAFAAVRVSRQLSHLALELEHVDIFDLRPLQPFAQQGLTNGLLAAGLISLISLFALDQGLTWMLLLFGGAATGVVGLAILLPMVGVRQRILETKRVELAWCEAELRRERQALRDGHVAPRQGRMADLLAYRTLVLDVRAWPFDTPALVRMLLFLLIPLGAWMASAVVQHLLERYILVP